MATIGLRDFYIAPITTDETGADTYGTPRRIARAISVDLSVEVAEAVLYADDSVAESIKEFVKGKIKLNADDIAQEDTAELLGQTQDADDVVYGGENDEPPYFAVGFRAKKSGGKYKYLWLYKTKFSIPSENYKTKADKIEFNTPNLEGEFIKRDDGNWKADYVGKPSDPVASKWFNAVREPASTKTPA